MNKINIGSLNIEKRIHLDKFIPFFKKKNLDIIALQEVCVSDVGKISEKLKMPYVVYQAMELNSHVTGPKIEQGVAIFSKYPLDKREAYILGLERIQTFYFLVVEIKILEKSIFFGTTHFPVTKEGQVTKFQLSVCNNLLKVLKKYPEIIFMGDFNAPRGRKVFDKIKSKFTDHIPSIYKTSIDQNLHRVKGLQYMVDGLFTTNNIKINNVTLHDNISDHMAITGELLL